MSEPKAGSGQIASNRPPFETFKRATCRGSILLGSACGNCERCAWERALLSRQLAKAPSKDEKLRALVDEWYSRADACTKRSAHGFEVQHHEGRALAYATAADELEELLKDAK